MKITLSIDPIELVNVNDAATKWMDASRNGTGDDMARTRENLISEMHCVMQDIFGDIPLSAQQMSDKVYMWYALVRKTFELPSTFLMPGYHQQRILFA